MDQTYLYNDNNTSSTINTNNNTNNTNNPNNYQFKYNEPVYQDHQQPYEKLLDPQTGHQCHNYTNKKTGENNFICDEDKYCKDYLNRDTGKIESLCENNESLNENMKLKKEFSRLKLGTMLFVVSVSFIVIGIWFVEAANTYLGGNDDNQDTIYWGLKGFGYFVWLIAIILFIAAFITIGLSF